MVSVSPWPLIGSMGALSITVSAVMYFHGYIYGGYFLMNAFLIMLGTMFVWWRDIISESTWGGYHTKIVVSGLRLGMILFMTSEVMFFFSFFWAFFHSSLAPNISIGCIWPPVGMQALAPTHMPLLNTLILLTSGVTITSSHYSLCAMQYYNWPFNDNYMNKMDLKMKNSLKLGLIVMHNTATLPGFLWSMKHPNYYKNMWELVVRSFREPNFQAYLDMKEWNHDLQYYNKFWDRGELELMENYWGLTNLSVYKNFHNFWKNYYSNDLVVKFLPDMEPMSNEKMFTEGLIWENRFFFWWMLLLYFPRINEISVFTLCLTIFLAIEFTLWQAFEYIDALFYMSDGIYGSTFYMTTGFHGLHVMIGTLFLMICLFRMMKGHFSYDHHFGFEAAMWYWHFVDVVWLFLFLWVYIWSYGF